MERVMVTYKVKPDRVAENEEFVKAVYEELHQINDPDIHVTRLGDIAIGSDSVLIQGGFSQLWIIGSKVFTQSHLPECALKDRIRICFREGYHAP